jgi:hypothetical protein
MKRYYRWCKNCGRVTEHIKEYPDLKGQTSYICLTCPYFPFYPDPISIDPSLFEYFQARKDAYEV